MAYKKTFYGNKYAYDFCKFVANTIADVKSIPVSSVGMGSEVFCFETEKLYVYDGASTWQSVDGARIDVGDFQPESTVWEELEEKNQ